MIPGKTPTRRFLAPEVVQTSAMDCGPAALKCLLEGYGVSVSYGRLREACQTDVDGTSIDTIEDLAGKLGLVAEQIMIPVDHLLLADTNVLPAIVVIQLPNGFTHFVVAWRTHLDRIIQIMDPATGRRWSSVKQFLDSVYLHTYPVSAADWRDWASSDDFLNPLRSRLQRIEVEAEPFITQALSYPDWRGLATLDAATRLVNALFQTGSIRGRRQITDILDTVIYQTQKTTAIKDGPIPEAYWSVWPCEPDADNSDGELLLNMRGAVLVSIKGVHQPGYIEEDEVAATLSPELEAALAEEPLRPGRQLWRMFIADGLLQPAALVPGIALAAFGVIFEAVLFRGLIDLGRSLGLVNQRVGIMTAVMLFIIGLLLLQMRITAHALRIGRQLDLRMRISFLEKIPRLRDQYFHSRPTSDMAQRSHFIYKIRDLPNLGAGLLRNVFTLILTTGGIIWLSPQTTIWALAAGLAAILFPVVIMPMLMERDLRVQTHVGSLSRFFLDSLLGLVAVRAHGAERSMRREHESLLIEWGRSALGMFRAIVWADTGQSLLGYGFAIIILFTHLSRGGGIEAVLLLVYWVLTLPTLGQDIELILRRYPTYRNVTLRLMEPLGAPEDEFAPSDELEPRIEDVSLGEGAFISMDHVSVRAAGNWILNDIDLQINQGDHVAIIGASGAGKSSLIGLLLGWHRPAGGRVCVDNQPLDGDGLARLRRGTAWVDPTVHLWNRPFLDNLYYGISTNQAAMPLPQVMEQAELLSVLRKLPEGLKTQLGEAGGLVSGGEGQRIRFGRAMLRPDVRLVLLDEPFRGLGREHRRELLKRSRVLWNKATLLCITHDVSETLAFGKVIVMDSGRIVEQGVPIQLAAERGSRYRAMLVTEMNIRKALWEGKDWRRLNLDHGRITERVLEGAGD